MYRHMVFQCYDTNFIFICELPVYLVPLYPIEESMGRKFRLSVHRKYEEKRATKLIVSILWCGLYLVSCCNVVFLYLYGSAL